MDRSTADALYAAIDSDPTLTNIAVAMRQRDDLRSVYAKTPLRLACAASFTLDPVKPSLELQAIRAGFDVSVHIAPYGQYLQELIRTDSSITAFQPNVVILAVRLQDVCPDIYTAFNSFSTGEADKQLTDWFENLAAALRTFRSHSRATILIQNYDQPAESAQGIADLQADASQRQCIATANDQLNQLAASLENVFVMDYDALVARHGRLNWADPRTALFARIPVAPKNYWALTGFYIRHLRPLYGLTKKVIVLDADHTLWGGVVGDVGLHGIALGHDFPGNAFVEFQKRLLDLYCRGVVLAIASKNEAGSVEEVLDKHPEMILRREHFAALRVNWDPKPQNVQQIAETLNLGLDSFVFIDDSPMECEMMRAALPQITTIQLPADPAQYPRIIESLDLFDQWSISSEDRQRGAMYKAEADRRDLQTHVVDMPSFYRQLQMKLRLFVNYEPHVARISQMTNRTNQFNMNTIRCSEDDIRRFLREPNVDIITLALEDRFGDNGTVGLAIVQHEGETSNIHMLLMSCRILGRTVEQTFIDWIAQRARAKGAKKLTADLVSTAKNKPFSGFYENCGFTISGSQGAVQRWTKELSSVPAQLPDWFEIEVAETASR